MTDWTVQSVIFCTCLIQSAKVGQEITITRQEKKKTVIEKLKSFIEEMKTIGQLKSCPIVFFIR